MHRNLFLHLSFLFFPSLFFSFLMTSGISLTGCHVGGSEVTIHLKLFFKIAGIH